jgi:glutamate:Na+ symporter, ESS family
VSGAAAVAVAVTALVLLLLVGNVGRGRIGVLRRWFIPGSLVAGSLALLAGPEVAGRVTAGLWPAAVYDTWAELPGLLITVVFASLFLGKRIPGPREVWRMSGPQVALGQALAWSHYLVGLLVALLLLGPLFALPATAGTLLEIGFIGGHGTSAGMAPSFDAAGFPEGTDLALGLATVGVIAAVLIGVAFVNWAVRTGRVPRDVIEPHDSQDRSGHDSAEYGLGASASRWALLPALLGIGVAIAVGWVALRGLVALEELLWADRIELLAYMPLFPFAMLGGIALQVALDRTGRGDALDRPAVGGIGALALDLLIIAALATLSLGAIGAQLGAFLLLAGIGLAWTVGVLIVLAPRMLPDHWVPRTAAEIGQGLGMVAAGLMLLRVADPDDTTPAATAFGYKQLLFEPVLGGGLFTAASVTLVATIGGWPVLAGVGVLAVGWTVLGIRLFRPEAVDARVPVTRAPVRPG